MSNFSDHCETCCCSDDCKTKACMVTVDKFIKIDKDEIATLTAQIEVHEGNESGWMSAEAGYREREYALKQEVARLETNLGTVGTLLTKANLRVTESQAVAKVLAEMTEEAVHCDHECATCFIGKLGPCDEGNVGRIIEKATREVRGGLMP